MDKWYVIDSSNNERLRPSMYETQTRAGQPVGTIIRVPGGVFIKDVSTALDTLFVQTSTGWYQPVFYKGSWFAHEVPDPNAPPPDQTPTTSVDVNITVNGAAVGNVIVNGITYPKP